MENNLWNEITKDSIYSKNTELYYQHILEQYKLYVEMADRISSRRNTANVFFLTLHTTVLTTIVFLFEKINPLTIWTLILPILCALIFCVVWWWLIRSYKNLNSAKYKVVGFLENKLPASPYWKAEWKELGEGKNIKKYLPLSIIETIIPVIFGIIYLSILVYVSIQAFN